MTHVEVKEYVSPALQKPEEGGIPQTGNSMMAAIMAKRNQMKKVGGGGAATGAPKPAPRPSAPQVGYKQPSSSTNSGFPKPPTNTGTKPMGAAIKPPSMGQNPVTSAAPKKPVTSGPAKPPVKMGGGGGGGGAFAAKMAALQARMGGGGGGGGSSSASSSTPASTAPSKPIVELCEGNTKRMDINKVIGNLEKEKKKQAKSSSKPVAVKVVSCKGKGIPPPPPPPPPPPKI